MSGAPRALTMQTPKEAREEVAQYWMGGSITAAALLGIVLLTGYRLRRLAASRHPFNPDDGRLALLAAARRAELALQHDDPGFTLRHVEAHVRELFRHFGEAIARDDLAPVHPWISDGLYQRLLIERRRTRAHFGADLHAGWALVEVSVAGVEPADTYQALRLRLRCVPKNPTERGGVEQRFQEWTFLRRWTTKTPKAGLLEGKCPHCGAPLEHVATGRCRYCDAVVNSGEHDWVLTDVAEGAAALPARVPTADPAGLRGLDPHLSREALEDRAAMTFWRWHEAITTGHVERLAAVASPAVCEAVRASPERYAPPGRLSVTTFRLRGLALDTVQRAWLEVSWAERADGGEGPVTGQRVAFLLERHREALTPQRMGLSTARCTRCLGPLDEVDARRCPWCEEATDDHWHLAEVRPWEDLQAWLTGERTRLGKSTAGVRESLTRLPAPQRATIVRALAAVAAVDGVTAAQEQAVISRVAASLAVKAPAVASPRAEGVEELSALSLGRDDKLAVLRLLFEVAGADGRFELAERRLIERCAARLGVPEVYETLLGEALRKARSRAG